jgi:hypothetical protein
MFRLFVLVATLGLTGSCANRPQIEGAFPLNEADAQEIQQLVKLHADIPKPVREIRTYRPDRAEVSTGLISQQVGSGSLVTVIKRRGKWLIDSVREEHILGRQE